MSVAPEQAAAGQAIYTKRILGIYDFMVLGISNRLIWRCPTQRLVQHYNRHITANHLDVGVGTGYFLDRCRFPSNAPRVALMDLNRNALDFAARRIVRYKPETYIRNVLEPLSVDAMKFDSVGIKLSTPLPSRLHRIEVIGLRLSQEIDESECRPVRFNLAARRRCPELARETPNDGLQ
jgi:hypothetical protein